MTKLFLPLCFLLGFCMNLVAQSIDRYYSYMIEKKYQSAFDELKGVYHSFDHENTPIVEYTKWIESAEHFRKNAICVENEKKASEQNKCLDRLIMINVIEMCAFDIYLIRAHKKGLKSDWLGSISDLDKSFEYALTDSQKSKVFYMKGISLFSLGKKDEACLSLSKAGELGKEDAYEIIKQYCN